MEEQYYEEDGIHFKAEFYPVWADRMAGGGCVMTERRAGVAEVMKYVIFAVIIRLCRTAADVYERQQQVL